MKVSPFPRLLKILMEGMVEEAVKEGKWNGRPRDAMTAGQLYDSIDMSQIVGHEGGRKERRMNEKVWITIANRYMESHKGERNGRRRKRRRIEG